MSVIKEFDCFNTNFAFFHEADIKVNMPEKII